MPLHQLPLANFYQGRILNFAHRGASAYAPENTMAAFSLAVEAGADGIEFDTQLSADGEAVVFHDAAIDRLSEHSGLIAELPLAELQRFDVGSYFSPEFEGERILTLDQTLEAFRDDPILFNIELKGTNNTLPQTAAERVKAHNLLERTLFSSFSTSMLRMLKRVEKKAAFGVLYRPEISGTRFAAHTWLERQLMGKPQAYHLHYSTIDEKLIRWAHRQHCRVNAWVANDIEEIRRLRDAGIDMIISDHPDLVQDVLQGER